MDKEFKKHLPYLIVILLALLWGFSPAIFSVYPFHDDIFFWGVPFNPKRFPMMCSITLYIGRIIGAMILWAQYSFVRTLSDLNILRLINSLVIAFCALGTYGLLYRYLKRPIDAALSAVMIFSLPACEVWAFHVGQSCELYTFIFVLIALYAVDRIPLDGPLVKRIFSKNGIICIFALFLANFTYPSLATFYWAMALSLILAQQAMDRALLRKKLENIYLAGFTAMVFFACIYKFRKYFIKAHFETAYKPDAVVSDLSDKSTWFFHTVMPQALNLWNIFPNHIMPVIIILFIGGALIVALLAELKKEINKDVWRKIISGFFIVTSLIVLTYLPNLICAINFNPYRCEEGLTALIVILLIWALGTYAQLLPSSVRGMALTLVLSIVCCWGIYRCFDNIDRFRAKPSALEFAYLKNSMDNFHGKLKEIYVVPRVDDLYFYYDEFGASTYGYERYDHLIMLINAMLVDIESQDGMRWMSVQLVPTSTFSNDATLQYFFKDSSANGKPAYSTFEIKIVQGHKPLGKLPDSTLLIDMNNLYVPLKQIMGKNYNFKVPNKGSWNGE